jgi:hypothetical protein
MSNANVIRTFETANYTVRISAEEEYDLDLSFDNTGRVQKQLERGDLIAFVAHVEVIHKPTGMVIGEDYLGGCIYKSFDDFMDHRACGKQNRKWAKHGKEGRCGSYFSQMISDAITEARESFPVLVDKLKLGTLRTVAA